MNRGIRIGETNQFLGIVGIESEQMRDLEERERKVIVFDGELAAVTHSIEQC